MIIYHSKPHNYESHSGWGSAPGGLLMTWKLSLLKNYLIIYVYLKGMKKRGQWECLLVIEQLRAFAFILVFYLFKAPYIISHSLKLFVLYLKILFLILYIYIYIYILNEVAKIANRLICRAGWKCFKGIPIFKYRGCSKLEMATF
jgi:hypothetical protein